MIDIIRSFADDFIFTTSLCPISPPAVRHLKAHPSRRSTAHASQHVRSN
jgi:5-aminolevulinate synthase